MDTLQINVKGWPDDYVKLVTKYAEELAGDLARNGLPNIPPEDRERLVDRGTLRAGTQSLPPELAKPPEGECPSGVLDELLKERASGR